MIIIQGGVGDHWEPDSWKEPGGEEESREKSQKHCGECNDDDDNDNDDDNGNNKKVSE